jgi:hypothetical protein
MKPDEIDFEVVLRYHNRLMEILKMYQDAGNDQPHQKDAAAKDAGVDFAGAVGEFQAQYGEILRKKALQGKTDNV